MRNITYENYGNLCQVSGDIRYGKYTCKAGCGGCCTNVGAALHQLVEYRQLDIKVALDDKTCTDILQKWDVLEEGQNENPLKFSEMQFYKADIKMDDKGCRGSRHYCDTPMFAFEPSESKIKNFYDDLVLLGKGLVFVELLSRNNFKPSLIYDTSISDFKNKKNTRITIARMFDNFLSNDCYYHIHDDGNRQSVEKLLRIDFETARKVAEKTLGQSTNDSWLIEGKKRLTTSNFGSAINRREHIESRSILKRIFTKEIFKTAAWDWGIQNKKNALEEHAIKLNLTKTRLENVGCNYQS